jgi:hypothetical protein
MTTSTNPTGLAAVPQAISSVLPGLPGDANTSYQIAYAAEDPRVAAYRMGLIEEARQLYNLPLDLPAYEVEGPSTGQIQAADLARQGIGAYEPYLEAGSRSLTQGEALAQQGANLAAGINVAPEFQSAQTALGKGLSAADLIGGYATTAGTGLGDITSGIGALQSARNMVSPYMQAGLGTSNDYLSRAGTAIQGAGPTGFAGEKGYLTGGMETARQATEAARGATQQGGFTTGLSAFETALPGSFTDTGVASRYETPYMQQVVDVQQKAAKREDEIARQGRAAQAVRAGAFGGTREAVAEAEAQRGLQDRLAQIQAMGSQQAFQQAQQQYNLEQQARTAANQALGQARLGTASTQAQLGLQAAAQQFQQAGYDANTAMQLAQLQQAQQGMSLQQAGAYQGLGGLYGQQALQQAQLGQTGAQLYGSLAAQQAQSGLLPAQLAQAQAGIQAQGANLYGSLGQSLGGLAAQRAGIDLQRAGTLGQMGQGIGQLGVNQAALGQAATQLGQADVSTMMSIGAMEQANEQAQTDAIRATQMQDVMAPFQQLAFVSDIYRGAPSTQSSLIGTSQPSASPFQTAAGLGIAALSAGAAAKKTGLI